MRRRPALRTIETAEVTPPDEEADMETMVGQELVGHGIFSRDGSKLGKVRAVISDEMANEYLVVGRFLSRDLVVPLHIVKLAGDRVVVPRTSSFVDCSPEVSTRDGLSEEDAERVERFYHED
jgi:ribosomal 30S subunit maturation factor RimM